ncbi:hypothetical protein COV06_00350 [Candidatus Uhrbacteria bacterium CG10_big_fil_rev_8_21_14_0_10_50_16]|uniref:Uncharacterized protein n=1 Tax=Candidatus Uhrbacteria bacterium CG10_big_fil_rev_8_21_14_0_10_50_16 TaxID=1975039 RepID=A0A2H0RMR2_9BACT|nr:MAG: hypothetical protein COV06_00350 [Candidatus Uhrbacteria bacterium CG10_big_fil_rev_8_21_14_0_10_50_16]
MEPSKLSALDFVRAHLASRGIHVPDPLPYNSENGARVWRVARKGIMLVIEGSSIDESIDVDLYLGDNFEDEDNGDHAVGMSCHPHDGQDGPYLWAVAVSPDAPKKAFGTWRAVFKPAGDTSLEVEIPHKKGLEWFDRMVDTFLAYTSQPE